ncbi:protein turtle-like isoform X2 [Brevipalpus obovatus]|uniref:protein turtle-like isoform X2 n=1 Tax=Brevipalpus obovatus TaxID=246614 RepID=UPI003D9EF2B3
MFQFEYQSRFLLLFGKFFWCFCAYDSTSYQNNLFENSGTKYKALAGGEIQLPCNITSLAPNDAISTIFWYKGDSLGSPLYTVDSRNSSNIDNARHFAGEALRNRATFNISAQFAFLSISPVKEDDNGEYRCRVDFRWSRTINTIVFLEIIVPAHKIVIKDGDDHELPDSVSSYGEGSSLSVRCNAYGGKPPPAVHWYSDGTLKDDSFTTQITDNGLITSNEMTISPLNRSNLNKVITCQAINTNLTRPITKSFTLDINLYPLFIKIISIKRPLSAGKSTEITCNTRGSRPAAKLIWYLGQKPLSTSRDFSEEDANGTYNSTSILNFVPLSNHNQASLICKSENLRLVNSSIRDEWLLNIYYTPKVEIFLRSPIEPNGITEGDEVIFECLIDSNPIVKDVGWFHNNQTLTADLKHGLVIENTTMVIKRIEKKHSGEYSCFAENIEGKNVSNTVIIKVNYAPTCRSNQQKLYVTSLGEPVRVYCAVDAEPKEVEMSWKVNQTILDQDVIANNKDDALVSSIMYTPIHERDYGTLECRARNKVGVRMEPCVFSVLPAERPGPVHDCSVTNQTWESVWITCQPGPDGGMNQTFIAQVYDNRKEKLLANLTHPERPSFLISGLSSSATYVLELFAKNSKGSSNGISITAQTLSMQEQKSEQLTDIKFDPYLAMAVALCSTFALVAIIIVLIITIRNRDERNDSRRKNCSTPIEFDERDIQEPDVVPSSRASKAYNIAVMANSSSPKVEQSVYSANNISVLADNSGENLAKKINSMANASEFFQHQSNLIHQKISSDCLSLSEDLGLTRITSFDDDKCIVPFGPYEKIITCNGGFNTLPRLDPRFSSRIPQENAINDDEYTFSTPV